MIDILYNKEGTPLLMQSTSLFATTESDKESIKERSRALFPYDDDRRDYIYLDDKRVVAWGQDNMFPQPSTLSHDRYLIHHGRNPAADAVNIALRYDRKRQRVNQRTLSCALP
ncbi:MAG: hypothetical protein IKH08_12315, partial [Prevotella sp.]|nr:hypothetical protein [Prevotella sp.]